MSRERSLERHSLDDKVKEERVKDIGEPLKIHKGKTNNQEYFIYNENFSFRGIRLVAKKEKEDIMTEAGYHRAYQDEDLVEELKRVAVENVFPEDKPVYFTYIGTNTSDQGQGLASVMFQEVVDFIKEQGAIHVVRFTKDGKRFIKPKYEKMGYKELELALSPKGEENYKGWMYFEYE